MTKLLLPKVETFVLPGAVPLEMVNIPAGTFMMGLTDPISSEQPHQVTIAQSFQMGKFEITKAQWQAVMGTTPWSDRDNVVDDPNSPAVYVMWGDAQSFITALNNLTGETFRLPTDAEWEYACRAGTTTKYYFGDSSSNLGDYAWWHGNAGLAGQRYAHVVGQKLPNAWGLYDMHGNVWEWCQDWCVPARYLRYSASFNKFLEHITHLIDWWYGPYSASLNKFRKRIDHLMDWWFGSARVLRGGAWENGQPYCLSAFRRGEFPDWRWFDDIMFSCIGFRVARSVTGGDGGGRVATRGDQRDLDPEGEVRRHVPSRMAPAVIDASVAGASLADEHRPMTPSQPSCPYRDLVVSGCWGYPELCNLPNGALLVSTSGGRCLEVNPDSGQATPQPDLAAGIAYIGHHLGSPTATATEPVLCCAAMRVVWTDLWQLGASRTSRVTPDGAVNSVALSPQGDLLAVGLGWYPADSSSSPCAAVELFSTADLSRSLARRVLPGVAVDCVMFHPSQNLLVAVTLDCSQIRGHVFLLDRQTLDLIDVAESDGTFCKAVMIDVDAERLLLAHRRGIRVRSLNEFWKVEWAWDTSDDLSSAVHDPERDWVYLSNGQVIAPGFGEVARLPALDKCSGPAILRDGRVAGINGTGVLRVWDVGLLPE